jgi:hypothetical protein
MQTKILLALSAVALLSATPSKSTAQTWTTVLDYQLALGKTATGDCIVADSLGNVFAAGDCYDASGTSHAIVLKTDTTEANWYFSDDTNTNATQDGTSISQLGLDASGNLYSVGALDWSCPGCSAPQIFWYVRNSPEFGVNWSTVDLYQYPAGRPLAVGTGFAADNSGNIYVAGWGFDAGTKKNPTGNPHWLVRKSSTGGQTWNPVDDVEGASATGAGFVPGVGIFVVGDWYASASYPLSWRVRFSPRGDLGTWLTVDGPITGGQAQGVCSDGAGNVYVVGYQNITITNKIHPLTTFTYSKWITRKLSNGGSKWSTDDSFTCAQNASACAFGIGKNAAGNVVVVGRAADSQGKFHWLVRTPDSSGVWQTINDFQLVTGYYASASGVATDAAGHLLVTGSAQDATGTYWIVRRLAP